MNDMPVDEEHEGYSLCAINGRYALSAGGSNDTKRRAKQIVILLDTQTGSWSIRDALPGLNQARFSHSSCATSSAVFVYGGRDFRDDYKDTVERLALKDIFDDTGEAKPPQWELFKISNFLPGESPLMVALKSDSILIAGGWLMDEAL